MRVTTLYEKKQPVISMEFFPPRNEKAAEKFPSIVSSLCDHKPDYMSVTFGAGGSTREGSYQTVRQLMEDDKRPTVAYIAGVGLGPDDVCAVLDRYQDLGVETIFVIRGDKPSDDSFTLPSDGFAHASDMLAYIREHYNFTLGCAGYPEGHVEAESLDKDVEYVRCKVESGADYVVTQYFYDNDVYFKFVDKCREQGITVPIIPGIMPVYTVKLTNNLCKLCGASLPPVLQSRLDEVDPEDKAAVLALGIDYAFEQCKGLLQSGVPGLHFYTMDRAKSTGEIIRRLRQDKLL